MQKYDFSSFTYSGVQNLRYKNSKKSTIPNEFFDIPLFLRDRTKTRTKLSDKNPRPALYLSYLFSRPTETATNLLKSTSAPSFVIPFHRTFQRQKTHRIIPQTVVNWSKIETFPKYKHPLKNKPNGGFNLSPCFKNNYDSLKESIHLSLLTSITRICVRERAMRRHDEASDPDCPFKYEFDRCHVVVWQFGIYMRRRSTWFESTSNRNAGYEKLRKSTDKHESYDGLKL